MDLGKLLVHTIDGKEVSFLVDEYHQRISRNLIFFSPFHKPQLGHFKICHNSHLFPCQALNSHSHLNTHSSSAQFGNWFHTFVCGIASRMWIFLLHIADIAVALQLSNELIGNFKIYETKLVQIPLMPYLIFFSVLRTILFSSSPTGLPLPTLTLLPWLLSKSSMTSISSNQRSLTCVYFTRSSNIQ